MWDTHTVEKMLESIVEPSKEIKEGFQSYRLATTDSKVYTGLRVKDDAKEVVIRDATGRDLRVAKDEVESMVPSKLSLMPDNVVSQLTYDAVHRPARVPQEQERAGVAARCGLGGVGGRTVLGRHQSDEAGRGRQ